MSLALRKCRYSRSPWRIGVMRPNGDFLELPYCRFERKREGAPVLAQLEALGLDWDQPTAAWSQPVYRAAWHICTQTADAAISHRLMARRKSVVVKTKQ